MTITNRERTLKIGFIAILLVISGILATGTAFIIRFGGGMSEIQRISTGIEGLAAGILSIAVCMITSVALTGFMAMRNGKTASAELFFYAVWAFCLGFEALRIISLGFMTHNASVESMVLVTRLVMFGRYSGLLNLFMGSILAVGFKQERMSGVLSAAFLLALFFASVQPVNSGVPAPDFLIDRGFGFLMSLFDSALIAMTLVNYVVAWRMNRDTAFLASGAGLALSVLAALLLRSNYSPWLILPAIGFLVAGAWLHIKSMNGYYLWR
ncbi:MAG: hypothetical protein A3J97_17125 [Spirochaetes bacterium RIFOXYC1_FULL_54_7]|nr:MAG: hypothetical protein A3J97_17125 [Spirochaetes bacterium RIFOXYC1_FULL_54_7]